MKRKRNRTDATECHFLAFCIETCVLSLTCNEPTVPLFSAGVCVSLKHHSTSTSFDDVHKIGSSSPASGKSQLTVCIHTSGRYRGYGINSCSALPVAAYPAPWLPNEYSHTLVSMIFRKTYSKSEWDKYDGLKFSGLNLNMRRLASYLKKTSTIL